MLTIDDKFCFSCDLCGGCCHNFTPVVTTHDIFNMTKNSRISTMTLFETRKVALYYNEKLKTPPIAKIGPKRLDLSTLVCHNLEPIIRSKQKSSDEHECFCGTGLQFKRCCGKEIYSKSRCSIYSIRPLQCRAFPFKFPYNPSDLQLGDVKCVSPSMWTTSILDFFVSSEIPLYYYLDVMFWKLHYEIVQNRELTYEQMLMISSIFWNYDLFLEEEFSDYLTLWGQIVRLIKLFQAGQLGAKENEVVQFYSRLTEVVDAQMDFLTETVEDPLL